MAMWHQQGHFNSYVHKFTINNKKSSSQPKRAKFDGLDLKQIFGSKAPVLHFEGDPLLRRLTYIKKINKKGEKK